MQQIKLDHVGWVTNNLETFERFWVDIIGFKEIFESHIPEVMNNALFGIPFGAQCKRYQLGEMVIEVHVYDSPTFRPDYISFNKFGINHIALHLEDRKKFLEEHDFVKHVYHNPKGWDNIFIEDFEGNWIELRETFK